MDHALQGLRAWDLLFCGPSLTFQQQCQKPLSWVTDQKYINRMNQHAGVKKGPNAPDASSHVWREDKLPVLQACHSLKMGLVGRGGHCCVYRSWHAYVLYIGACI